MSEVEELREQVVAWVVPGFHRRAEVVEMAVEYVEDGVLSDAQIGEIVDEVWSRRLREQQTWPESSDADRFAAAFAELDAAGVVARMNFTCCQTCGHAEIHDERPTDRPSTAYTFFHQQDTDNLAEDPADLFLAYGAFDVDEASWESRTVEAGHRIASVLRAHDLPVTWSGSSGQRIQVGPLSWRRVLPEG